MAKTAIKAKTGRIIGWREDAGDEVLIRNFTGNIVGKYKIKEDITRDFYGKYIGKGDQLMGLLYEDIYNRGDPLDLDAIKH